MKVVIINGSPRKGNTYAVTQLFKNEMISCGDVEFTEFFLPQDMPKFCKGCMLCFEKGEQYCPHSEYTLPILEAMIQADAFILTTPVYVMQVAGTMKTFLDHYGFMFMVHRARPEMFKKKAFVISTTAGAGTKFAIKTITTNLKFWGVNRVYSYGFPLFEISYEKIKPKRKVKIDRKIKKSAKHFYNEILSEKKHRPYLFVRMMFFICRAMVKRYDEKMSIDKKYWIENKWFSQTPF